jgi:glucose/arabinose dehydrogenase
LRLRQGPPPAAPLARRALLACVAGLLLLPAAASAAPFDSAAAEQLTAAAAASDLPAGFTESVAWSGLSEPTTLRFAPDGRVFVALKSGIIDVFDNVDDTTPTVYADLRTLTAAEIQGDMGRPVSGS